MTKPVAAVPVNKPTPSAMPVSSPEPAVADGRQLLATRPRSASDTTEKASRDSGTSCESFSSFGSTFSPGRTDSTGSGVTTTSAEASIEKSPTKLAPYPPDASPPRRATDRGVHQIKVGSNANFPSYVILYLFEVSTLA